MASTQRSVVPAATAWHAYRWGFGFALHVATATFTLWLIDGVGAGALALALIGTTLEVCYAAAEVPTGVVADRRGRKLSILVGLVVVGTGMLLVTVPVLATVLVAQVLIGGGWTFLSGADVAWLTDEVGEDAARPLYASGKRAELRGSVAGIVAGAAIGQVTLWLPLVVSALTLFAVAAWLWRRMHESDRQVAQEERLTVAETVRRTRASVRRAPAMAALLAMMVAAGLAGEGVDRLWQLHLVGDEAGEGSTVVLVSGLFLAGLLLAVALTAAVERRLAVDVDGGRGREWLVAENVLIGVSVLALAVGPLWLGATGLVASYAIRHACEPLVLAWANRGADPTVRATLNSLVGQAESVGEIAGGPALGAIGGRFGTGPSLVTSAGVFGVAALLTRWRR
jgi:DHA3 family tetracycline resistance protein-like MFS transporter